MRKYSNALPWKVAATRLGLYFHSARTVAAILCAVVRGQHLEFGNRIRVRIDVQRRIAAVIHIVAAIQLPVVVLSSAPIHAKPDVAVDADLTLIRTGLIDHTRRQRNELREVAAVELELIHLRCR